MAIRISVKEKFVHVMGKIKQNLFIF